jgi:diamine N-acetyltransferase
MAYRVKKLLVNPRSMLDIASAKSTNYGVSTMSEKIHFEPFTRDNWEAALKLQVDPSQSKFAPSVAESLAAAYIKPWDEALDPYIIYDGETMAGCFYLSYTPGSESNYWIGGFIIDRKHQGKGLGKASLKEILRFVGRTHPNCREVNLTVEKDNVVAQGLYKSLGFGDTGRVNKYGEIIYTLKVRQTE